MQYTNVTMDGIHSLSYELRLKQISWNKDNAETAEGSDGESSY